jgi:hypothetical protein
LKCCTGFFVRALVVGGVRGSTNVVSRVMDGLLDVAA